MSDKTSTTPKTAVLYARYSSDKQREASIDDQLRVCREFCAQEGIEILRVYTDYALSGKTDQRPQFRQMIANAPESDYVVVYMFDRFSRDRYDSATYKRMLRECGVRVISASEKVEDTPEGGLQEGLLEILSEYYVKDLARKVRRGMEGNALKAMNNGYKIFGYATDPETRRYVIDEEEAKVVREIFTRYIGGESIYGIASSMAKRGFKTSQDTPVDYNWVSRALNRKAYTGVYTWGGIEVEGGMPQIIDAATFAKAAATPKRKPRHRETWADYRLSGKLYCGLCGESMHGYGGTGRNHVRYYYYGCKEKNGCGRRGVRREFVEDALTDAILWVTSDEQRMRMVARRVVEAYEREIDVSAELEACDAQIAELEQERHNISVAARMGLVTPENVERNNEIGRLLDGLHSHRDTLVNQSDGFTEDEVVEFLMHGFGQADADFLHKTFVNRIFLFDGFLVATFNFRDGESDLAEVKAAIDRKTREKEFRHLRRGPSEYKETPAQSVLGSSSSGVGGGT